MSEKKTPAAPKLPSGEHQAVKTMRSKLESISDGETAAAIADLDKALNAYLEDTGTEKAPDTLPEEVPPVCRPNPILRCRCSLGTNGCMVQHE